MYFMEPGFSFDPSSFSHIIIYISSANQLKDLNQHSLYLEIALTEAYSTFSTHSLWSQGTEVRFNAGFIFKIAHIISYISSSSTISIKLHSRGLQSSKLLGEGQITYGNGEETPTKNGKMRFLHRNSKIAINNNQKQIGVVYATIAMANPECCKYINNSVRFSTPNVLKREISNSSSWMKLAAEHGWKPLNTENYTINTSSFEINPSQHSFSIQQQNTIFSSVNFNTDDQDDQINSLIMKKMNPKKTG